MMLAALTAIGEAVSTWFQGRTEIKKAEVEREVKALNNEANWDEVQAQSSKNSWKDEWLTLLISIPLVLAFIPSTVQYVYAGFEALKMVPDWYMTLVFVVFSASFGIKGLASLRRSQ